MTSKLGLSKLGSMGDLSSLFEFSSGVCVEPLIQSKAAPQQQPGGSECGVDTPGLSSCSEGEGGLLCVPDAAHVPKRRRT